MINKSGGKERQKQRVGLMIFYLFKGVKFQGSPVPLLPLIVRICEVYNVTYSTRSYDIIVA